MAGPASPGPGRPRAHGGSGRTAPGRRPSNGHARTLRAHRPRHRDLLGRTPGRAAGVEGVPGTLRPRPRTQHGTCSRDGDEGGRTEVLALRRFRSTHERAVWANCTCEAGRVSGLCAKFNVQISAEAVAQHAATLGRFANHTAGWSEDHRTDLENRLLDDDHLHLRNWCLRESISEGCYAWWVLSILREQYAKSLLRPTPGGGRYGPALPPCSDGRDTAPADLPRNCHSSSEDAAGCRGRTTAG